MVKQCPRCWVKLSPGDEVCPNCGYDLVHRTAPTAKKVAVEEDPADKKRVIFPTPKKKGDKRTCNKLRLATALVLVWSILAVLGGIFNIASGNVLQGAGLLASGVIGFVAFCLIDRRDRCTYASVAIILSGAATIRIELLIVAVVISILVYASADCFNRK